MNMAEAQWVGRAEAPRLPQERFDDPLQAIGALTAIYKKDHNFNSADFIELTFPGVVSKDNARFAAASLLMIAKTNALSGGGKDLSMEAGSLFSQIEPVLATAKNRILEANTEAEKKALTPTVPIYKVLDNDGQVDDALLSAPSVIKAKQVVGSAIVALGVVGCSGKTTETPLPPVTVEVSPAPNAGSEVAPTEVVTVEPSPTLVQDPRYSDYEATLTPEGKTIIELGGVKIIDGPQGTGVEDMVLNQDGDVVAFRLKDGGAGFGPFVEQSWQKYGFEKTEDGGWRKSTAMDSLDNPNVENLFSIDKQGAEMNFSWKTPDQMRDFWDEGHPLPSEGTLVVSDNEGHPYMYFSKELGGWKYAGYKIEGRGNITYLMPGALTERFGLHFAETGQEKDAYFELVAGSNPPAFIEHGNEDNSPVPEERFLKVRQTMEWLAVKNHGGHPDMTFEEYKQAVDSGETFTYTIWLRDTQTGEATQHTFTTGEPTIYVLPGIGRYEPQHSISMVDMPGTKTTVQSFQEMGAYSVDNGGGILINIVMDATYFPNDNSVDLIKLERVSRLGSGVLHNSQVLSELGAPDSWMKDGDPAEWLAWVLKNQTDLGKVGLDDSIKNGQSALIVDDVTSVTVDLPQQ